MKRNPSQRLTVARVVNRLPTFNVIRGFVAAFTAVSPRYHVLGTMSPHLHVLLPQTTFHYYIPVYS